MENKNINKEISEFCNRITKNENKVAILVTDNGMMMSGGVASLLSALTMILKKMGAAGIPEELLKDTFDLSKKTNSEIKEQTKALNKKKFDNKIEKIEKLLNLLKEINNE